MSCKYLIVSSVCIVGIKYILLSNLWLWPPLLSHHFPKIPKVSKIQGNKNLEFSSFDYRPCQRRTTSFPVGTAPFERGWTSDTPFSYPDPDHSFWNYHFGSCAHIQRNNSLAILTGRGGYWTFQGRGLEAGTLGYRINRACLSKMLQFEISPCPA